MLSRTFLLLLLCFHVLPLQAELRVFACEPEWRDLVLALVPEAQVYTATTAWQDPHYIQARPSLIAKMRSSDLAVCTGASLEAGWLPSLIERSAHDDMSTDEALFFAALHTELHQEHEHIDRSMGDVHPEGNPHFHLNPKAIPRIMKALAKRIQAQVPQHGQFVNAHLFKWSTRWKKTERKWKELAQQLRGTKVVVQHSSFEYLLNYAGIDVIADLEPKPGLPPSAAHLKKLLDTPYLSEADAILVSYYQDLQPAKWLSERTGIPVLVLPTSPTNEQVTEHLDKLISYILERLVELKTKR